MSDEFEIGIFERLSEPFPIESIHWRVGATNAKQNGGKATKGVALAYIDARDVMDRLDIVCGPEGWQDKYIETGNGATCCSIGIALSDPWNDKDCLWIWKSDGAGRTDYEGDKGQFSDAFKRAAVKFGVGRYLYDLPAPWVELDDMGRIAKSELDKLNQELSKTGNRQQWGDRNTYNMYRLFRDALKAFVEGGGDVDQFVKEHSGTIAQLKVGAKRELEQEVERLREMEIAA